VDTVVVVEGLFVVVDGGGLTVVTSLYFLFRRCKIELAICSAVTAGRGVVVREVRDPLLVTKNDGKR
jgi:hypothetical protein